jgi:hypothetical protein
VCDGEGQCVLAPGAQKVTASCAVARGGVVTGPAAPLRTTGLAVLALSGLLRRRRRRSHSRGGSSKQ